MFFILEKNGGIAMERKAILVGVNLNNPKEDFEYSMQELANLTEACNIQVIGKVTQNLHRVHQGFYVGTGKLEELKAFISELQPDMIIFDEELSPAQIRNLESELVCEVKDRTMLILDIFAERAKTKESQLQVEMARLKYLLPRLIGTGEHMGRQGGGAGLKNRGTGETKLELDRRKIQIRIAALDKELEKIVEQRQIQRKQRKKNNIPVVSLVGYTNAGKSTIMNAFVERFNKGEEKQVFEKNMLFATLETSVRNITLEDHKSFLLTDTVGFINKLPHQLVKAFRSTLEEVTQADLIVHVIDFSNPNFEEQRNLTNQILEELGANDIPMIYVYNKADQTDIDFPRIQDNEVYLSAKKRMGIDELTQAITGHIFKDFVKCTVLIPYTAGDIVSYLNENARVLSTEYEENGTKMVIECSQVDAERFQAYVLS